ncbi:branched-chain amino acid ABC transporter permease [Isoptericola sp. NEAU-Y5]|uniref:Branched-chain amino acid ABC transporter permease n=1 Tax=Isoptericola luteus TaxID=2879484 RepID=A0ABS7ZEP1_9MICO|nr:branched-chain amino acid ABC transporter permease [Isoptericola sp. NEAU-Y5]MCA5893492.1 branched-chain amino acid ABC transporter permease [Isoptericola sp. NEAU-Y5]
MTRSPARPGTRAPRTTRAIVVRAVLLTLLALALTFALDPFRNYQLAVIAATFCATAGLTLLVGLTGQLSLGHAVLMAAGGYGYALVAGPAAEAGLGGTARFALGILGALVLSAAVGGLLGLAGARLRGPYLAGLTLALVIALPALTTQVPGLGKDQGLGVPFEAVPAPLAGLMVVEQWHAWIAVVVAALAVTPLVVLRSGRAGLRMRATHGDEVAARLAGISPARVKVGAFVVSAVAAGLGGAVLAVVTQSVSPGRYSLAFSLLLLVAVVVGGLGSIGGAAAGAALVVLLPWLVEALTSAGGLSADLEQRLSGNLALAVFGALLVAVTVVWPGGLAAASAGPRGRLARALRRSRADDGPGPTSDAAPAPASDPTSDQASYQAPDQTPDPLPITER